MSLTAWPRLGGWSESPLCRVGVNGGLSLDLLLREKLSWKLENISKVAENLYLSKGSFLRQR
jgi:hypothetical protein